MIKILYVHGYKGDKYGSSFQSLVKYADAFGVKGYSLLRRSVSVIGSSETGSLQSALIAGLMPCWLMPQV